MKVVYNSCFGGFELSKEAVDLLAKLKGFDLSGLKFEYGGYANSDHSVTFGYDFSDHEKRSDKDLVKVVESLGEKANADCSDLKIFEVPDGKDFEIDKHYGSERVVPPRQKW